KACAELRDLLGAQSVLTTEERLQAYRDPYSPGLNDRFVPAGVISPATVEEIKAVLGVARSYRVPLWSVSLGRNYAYGGAAHGLTGSMILALSRMQAIEVNEDLAYAVVEPGVTYIALYKAIQDKKLRLWVDCTDPGWGSVLGNALERGVGYTPLGDHAAN